MDARLEKALETAKLNLVMETQKSALKRRFDRVRIFYHDRGMFLADSHLINAAMYHLTHNNSNDYILLDMNSVPIKISVDALPVFIDNAENKWNSALKDYHDAYTVLGSARTVKEITGIANDAK
jgi:hypothetical protein